MKKNEIDQKWLNQQKECLSDVSLESSNYSSDVVRKLMKTSLLFWKFVREILRQEYSEDQRNKFLLQYTRNENKYIALIAKIEMLPVRTWRKCLWRYNLDFMSFESFLRRITPEQKLLIHQNWIDVCFNKKSGRVLSYRLIDKFLLFIYAIFKFLGFRKNLNKATERMYNQRYFSKSAWEDNLAFLDFGFGMYTEGISSDEKNLSGKASRFLSIKTHVNDFVVNQEDGVYWFFYRFRRSFGAISKMSSIELSSWICPGFWLTLIMMVWFLTGPVVGLSIVDYSVFSFSTILGIVLTAPFIFWLAAHVIIKLADIIGFLISFLLEKIENKKIKKTGNKLLQFLRPVFYVLGFIIIVILFMLIGNGLILLKNKMNNIFIEINLFNPMFGVIILFSASLYLIGSLLHLLAFQKFDDGELSSSMIENGSVEKSIQTNLLLWIITVVMLFRHKIWSVITAIGEAVWRGLTWFGNFLLENALPLSLLILLVISTYYIAKIVIFSDDEKFHKNRKKAYIAMIISIGSLILLFATSFEEDIIGGLIVFSPILVSFLVFFMLLLLFSTTQRSIVVTEETVEKKKVARNSIKSTNILLDEKRAYNISLFYQKLVVQNKNLNRDNVSSTFKQLVNISKNLSLKSLSIPFLGAVLKTVKPEKVLELDELINSEAEYKLINEKLRTKYEKVMFAKLFLSGKSKDEAVKRTLNFFIKKSESRKKRKVQIDKLFIFLGFIAIPFIRIYNIVRWILLGLVKVVVNLYRFWKIMSKEACPYVGEQKYLG